MAQVLPFKALRVKENVASQVSAPPYDVLNADEAREMAKENDISFLHVSKSEIDLPAGTDDHSDAVYQKARENFEALKSRNVFHADEAENYYIYRLSMNGRSQTGLVVCCTVDDYFNDVIKKHEFTRPVKENDRIRHTQFLGAQTGPVFSVYNDVAEINAIVSSACEQEVAFDFTTDTGIRHTAWVLSDTVQVKLLQQLFAEKVPAIYIADGHHRAASYSKLGKKLREENAQHNGAEEYNKWLSVLFPASQTAIMDYNRVVKDLNGLSEEDFMTRLTQNFSIEKTSNAFKPEMHFEYGMYFSKQWYKLTAHKKICSSTDVIEQLDISVLSKYVLDELLGIKDQRTDMRIDFVGGIRGMSGLEKRVDSGEMQIAFSIPAVTIQQLMQIADSGNVMPPKTTWFEPKLRDGLFIHAF